MALKPHALCRERRNPNRDDDYDYTICRTISPLSISPVRISFPWINRNGNQEEKFPKIHLNITMTCFFLLFSPTPYLFMYFRRRNSRRMESSSNKFSWCCYVHNSILSSPNISKANNHCFWLSWLGEEKKKLMMISGVVFIIYKKGYTTSTNKIVFVLHYVTKLGVFLFY